MTTSVQQTYLVQIADAIVRQDIVQIIRTQHPAADIVAVDTGAAAVSALGAVRAVALAFVELGPDDPALAALGARVTALGGAMVVVGEWRTTRATPELRGFLERPFTSDNVIGFLSPQPS